MKTYQGMKTFDGEFEIQVVCAGSSVPLLGPDGRPRYWTWGDPNYSTAFCLLADALQDVNRARSCYQTFAKTVIVKLDPNEGWTLDYYDLVAFADKHTPVDSGDSGELL